MSKLEQLIGERFDILSETFPSHIDDTDARLNAILSRLGDPKGKKILEVGCGKGRISKIFKARGADVYGIDIAEKFLNEAKLIRPGGFLKAEAASLPYKADTFDAVVLLEVIEHIPDLLPAFKELTRVLKKDGLLVIVDRNKFSVNNRRFLVPNLIIKRYHELKNEWMYPNDFPFREIWFNPHRVHGLFRRYFLNSGYEYVLSDGEEKRWWHFIFKIIPQVRHFVLWHGTNKR